MTMTSTAVLAPDEKITVQSLDARTDRLLRAPVVPLLARLAFPNVLIMVAQSSTGLIETWWVSKLGTDALAGMALVFPAVMLMTTISAGAIGGSISSAIARALGGGRRELSDALAFHALVITLIFGVAFSVLFLLYGEPIYRAFGGTGGELRAAVIYSNVVFAGSCLVWLMNGLASLVRGTGNMIFPAFVTCIGVVFLIPVSPLLIFGFGPIPGFGIAGGGLALLVYYAGGTVAMALYLLKGRTPIQLRPAPIRWAHLSGILRVGGLSAINSVLNNVIIAGTTSLVAAWSGVAAVAGYGTAARLEYLLIPLIFGIGAPMVALVGTNLGAGKRDRALHIALAGAAMAFAATEAIGVFAALAPGAWMRLFTTNPNAVEAGTIYLRIVGPFYGFFGLGLALYFASQGAGRVIWPTISGFLRLAICIGGGYFALRLTGSLTSLFIIVAASLFVYGCTIFGVMRGGRWLEQD